MDEETGIPPQREREIHDLHPIHDSGPAKARAVLWTRIFVVCATMFSVLMFALLLTGVLLVRQTQLDNAQRAEDTRVLAEQIKSCTIPDGACYQRGEKRTAAAVGAIGVVNKRSAAAAAACAQTRSKYQAILDCINATLGVRTPQ